MFEPFIFLENLEIVPEYHAVPRGQGLALLRIPDHLDDASVTHHAHETASKRHAGLSAPLHEITLEFVDIAEPYESEPAKPLMLCHQAFLFACACFHGNHPFHICGRPGRIPPAEAAAPMAPAFS